MSSRALAATFVILLAVGLLSGALANELQVQSVLGGKVELSLPAGLAPADEETKRTWHYPSDMAPPEALFVDASGRVSIAVNVRRLPSMTTDKYLVAMDMAARKSDMVTLHNIGKRVIKERTFGFVEFTARRSSNVGIYNYIYFTFDEDQLIEFVVNCTTDKLPEWEPLLDEVVASTRVLTST